jgi:hypothetical protein
VVVVETVEPERRSRRTLVAVTVGVVVAAALVAYGFSRSDDDDDRAPSSTTTPIIGVIQAPADVATTQLDVRPVQSAPATDDVPTIPTGTADFVFPAVSSDIPAP